MWTVTAPRTAAAPAVPCTGCGTTEGSKRKSGQYVRYRGERFGVVGMLCATCRAREVRHQKARALGFEPGRVGRRPTSADRPRRDRPDAPGRGMLSPEQVAENLREVREEGERNGRRPRAGDSPLEVRQRRWADLAASDRRRVVEARRQAMARA